MKTDRVQTIVKSGIWLYDNLVEKEIRIIEQNWDYYYEDDYSEDPPHLNKDGIAYYVVFDKPLADGSFSSRSETLYTVEEAIQHAIDNTNNTLKWD